LTVQSKVQTIVDIPAVQSPKVIVNSLVEVKMIVDS
jgi:hypothetical protein